VAELVVMEGDQILSARTQVKRGEIKEWQVLVENSDGLYNNYFRIGDIVTLYLGWGAEYVEELKGIVLTVNEIEQAVLIGGYDYSDYLAGPHVDKEYGDVDWSVVLRDVIATYTGLNGTAIPNVGVTTGGRIVYVNRELWSIIHEIMDEIDYDIRVNSDLTVDIYARETDPTYSIKDEDFEEIRYKQDRSKVVNKLVIRASNEKIVDSFENTTLSTENWDVKTGTWEIKDFNLKFSGAVEGLMFSQISAYGTDLSVPIKQSGSWADINIYFRRTEEASEEGYKIVIKSGEIELRNAQSDALLDNDNTVTFAADTWYTFRVTADEGTLKVYIDGAETLSVVDTTFESGEIAFKNPASSTVYYDYINFTTDTPVHAISEDTDSQDAIGIKEVLLQRPEVNSRVEAQRVADLELARRKFDISTLWMTTEGNMDLSVGEVVRFATREPYLMTHYEDSTLVVPDYLIIGITQIWDGGQWDSKYELAEIVPELEEVLAMLRTEVNRGAITVGIPRTIVLTDSMDSTWFTDNLKNLYTEYDNQVGGSRIGFTWRMV